MYPSSLRTTIAVLHLPILLPLLHPWPSIAAAAAAPPHHLLHANHPQCWDDPTSFGPIVYKDCIELINQAVTTEPHDADLPLKFSNNPSMHPDIRLPRYWKRTDAKCGLALDFAPQRGGYDRTTLNDVRRAASAVAVQCIIKPPHLGGYMELGWYNRLGVLVTGRRAQLNALNGTVSES
ncbi:MAG: hypothetical protein Q9216_001611 [Gyalolechia sp. 2 TL-2023]